MNYAQPADVQAVMPTFTPDQSTAVAGLIAQASTLVKGWGVERGLDTDAIYVAADIKADLIKIAVVNAVKRALRGLTGIASTSFAIDDYQQTDRLDQSIAAGEVFINDTDLAGIIPGRSSKFGMIRMGSAL